MAVNATVLYEFTAESSLVTLGDIEIESAAFVLETTEFITSDSFFDPSDLLSCSVQLVTGTAICESAGFLFDLNPNYHAIAFGLTPDHSVVSGAAFAYFFEQGAFGAYGTYDTQLLGDRQSARLTVRPAPAPMTLSMLLLGLLALGLQRRNNHRPAC